MTLEDKLLEPSLPVAFFELVPPASDKAASIDSTIAEVQKVRHLVDAINLPEVRDENRGPRRTAEFVPRIDPRILATRILRELTTEVVVNHVVVHEPNQEEWFRKTREEFGVSHAILVGGESSKTTYPGPSVLETAQQVRSMGLGMSLGGITIPSRLREADRIRRKNAAGLAFFTTQVLFDSNDIVWLIQRLNGLEARVFLSFAPVSHPRDTEFLRWLGADIPRDLDRFLLGEEAGRDVSPEARETCLERSLDLAQRILMDVFDNLPPDPPPLGLNIEHINKRNFAAALKMLDRLGSLYANLVAARV